MSISPPLTGINHAGIEKLLEAHVFVIEFVEKQKAKKTVPPSQIEPFEKLAEKIKYGMDSLIELAPLAKELAFLRSEMYFRGEMLRHNIEQLQQYEVVREMLSSGTLAETIAIVLKAVKDSQQVLP